MAVKFPIFMDSNSTTPVDPRVLEAMIPYFTEKFGHPGSRNHSFGWEAEGGMEQAREQLARLSVGERLVRELEQLAVDLDQDRRAGREVHVGRALLGHQAQHALHVAGTHWRSLRT
jgi:hypothetical protein